MAQSAKLRAMPYARQSALERGDFSRKVIQAFQELVSMGPGYEVSAIKDNDHIGVFEGRAASNIQELDEFTFRIAPRALCDVIRRRKSCPPKLLCETVELLGFQLICNVK
jgi:hypothetical protein